jgi:hypothetical protein
VYFDTPEHRRNHVPLSGRVNHMSKAERKSKMKERRVRRNQRNAIALQLARHLLGEKPLSATAMSALLKKYVALAPKKAQVK